MTSTATPVAATASTVRSTSAGLVPPASARSMAAWTTGPSSSGSVYGRPISITSAPACAIALPASIAPSTVGKPAGRYPTRTARPSSAALVNAAPTAVIG